MKSDRLHLPPSEPPVFAEPREFEIHGVRVRDDFAWLKADNWMDVLKDPAVLPPRIRAHLEAENAFSQAVLAGAAPLREQNRRRNARPHQGGRLDRAGARRRLRLLHPLPRGRPAPARLPRAARRRAVRDPSRRRRRGEGRRVLRSPRRRPFPRPPASRLERRHQGFGATSRSGSATSRPGRISPTRCSRPPARSCGARIRRPSTMSRSTKTIARSGSSATASARRQRRTRSIYEETEPGWFIDLDVTTSALFIVLTVEQSRDLGGLAARPQGPERLAPARRRARRGRALFGRPPRQRPRHPDERRRRRGFQDRHGAARRVRTPELARAHPAPAGHHDPLPHGARPPSRAARARGRRTRASSCATSGPGRSTPSISTRRPIR